MGGDLHRRVATKGKQEGLQVHAKLRKHKHV